jgi:hypothetical protein
MYLLAQELASPRAIEEAPPPGANKYMIKPNRSSFKLSEGANRMLCKCLSMLEGGVVS